MEYITPTLEGILVFKKPIISLSFGLFEEVVDVLECNGSRLFNSQLKVWEAVQSLMSAIHSTKAGPLLHIDQNSLGLFGEKGLLKSRKMCKYYMHTQESSAT